MKRSRLWVLLVLAVGCTGSVENPEGGVAVERVSAQMNRIFAKATAVNLLAGETLLSVSSEGDAWLRGDAGLRVLRAEGGEVSRPVSLNKLDRAIALDDDDALMIADQRLWRASAAGITGVETGPVGVPLSVCGDPLGPGRAFVGSRSGLWENVAGEWWNWQPDDFDSFEQIRSLGSIEGQCSAGDNEIWLISGATIWQLRFGEAPRAIEVDGIDAPTALAVDPELGAAVQSGNRLFVGGPAWREVVFEAGPIRLWTLRGGALWVAAGAYLYRYVNGIWERVDAAGIPSPETFTALQADSNGGAWAISGGQIWRVQVERAIYVRSIRPWETFLTPTVDFVAHAGAEATALTIDLDGINIPVPEGSGAAGTWTLPGFALGAVGAHTLSLRADVAGKIVQRSIRYEVAPLPTSWQEKVAPLYQTRCAPCHAADSAIDTNMSIPDLPTFEAWSMKAQQILDRVRKGQMPPTAPLSAEELGVIEQWIQGGMRP